MKLLKGTNRPSRSGLTAIAAAPAPFAFEAPEWLSEPAAEEWRRLEPALRVAGVLTESDLAPFAHYCTRFAAARRAQRLADEAKTDRQWMLWDGVARKAWDAMSKAAQQLGLTPASREKVGRVAPAKVDPLDRYIRPRPR